METFVRSHQKPAVSTRLSSESLNNKLNELRLFLGHLENYSEEKNVAFNSLKNLGIWLLLFALVDKDFFQDRILEQAVGQANRLHVKALIEELIQLANLTQIINDYKQCHGEFTFEVAPSLYTSMQKKAEEAGLAHLLLNHMVSVELKNGLTVKLKSEIKFNWADTNSLHEKLEEDEEFSHEVDFRGLEIPGFVADGTRVDYAIIAYQEAYYHVSRFNAQADDRTNALPAVYLIQAADADDQFLVQQNYYSIIKKFPVTPDYADVHALSDEHEFPNLYIGDPLSFADRMQLGDRIDYTYRLTIKFPKLNGVMQTPERRLGMYEFFIGKPIGSTPITSVQFSGERLLSYDNKVLSATDQQNEPSQERSRFSDTSVMITHVYDNTFMVVYVTPHGADYIPFQVAEPLYKLEQEHSTRNSIKRYPNLITQRKWDEKPDEVTQPVSQPVTGTTIITQEASQTEEKCQPIIDDIELFKKFYRSIQAGKSSFFKSDFFAGKEGLSRIELRRQVMESTDKDVNQALALARKYQHTPLTEYQKIFSEIYLYAFDQSHIFSRAKVDNQFFYSKKSLVSYLAAQHNGVVPRKAPDQIEPNSRTDRIISAFHR
jgi:hypothetical protein